MLMADGPVAGAWLSLHLLGGGAATGSGEQVLLPMALLSLREGHLFALLESTGLLLPWLRLPEMAFHCSQGSPACLPSVARCRRMPRASLKALA